MAYWLSHAMHDGSSSLKNRHSPNMTSGCIVSIVLDDSARLQFSAIHLSIVSRDSDDLNNPNIFESFDPRRHIHSNFVSNATYRSRLCQRTTIEKNRSTTQATFDASICTVVFMVVKTRDMGVDTIALVPLAQSSEASDLRVVYHRVHPCDAANSALLVFLDSNYVFSPAPSNVWTSFFPLGVPVHSVRIVPLGPRQQILPLTQPLIILRIVNFAIGQKPPGWRKTLLNYALTCKSWTHVLSLFYERLDGTYERDPVDVTAVARSLKAKPEYGQLMPALQYWDYSHKSRSEITSGLKGWHAFLDIIRYATSVTAVSLASIPTPFVDQFVLGLSNLQKVRKCYFTQGSGSLSMANIQRFITNWKELQILEVRDWADQPDVEAVSDYLGCRIEELGLQAGVISGPQFLRFAKPMGCRVTRLAIEKVHGISNHDFYIFLSAAAATLVAINIYESPMPRLSSDEELALDAAMPMMKNLERLEAPHVSVLGLSRKPTVTRVPDVNKPSSITVCPVGDISLQQVAAAMEVTGWDSISLLWRGSSGWDISLAETAVNAAIKRGVNLVCSNNYSS